MPDNQTSADDSDDAEDTGFRLGAYEQFMRDDPPEDSVYDSFR